MQDEDDSPEATEERLTGILADLGGFVESHPRWTPRTLGVLLLTAPDGDDEDGRQSVSLIVSGASNGDTEVRGEILQLALEFLKSTFGLHLVLSLGKPSGPSQN